MLFNKMLSHCVCRLQYFSRTDRLLKHKRTCGEAIKKELSPGMDLGCGEAGEGSYGITQGNTGRKRGKSKNSAEGGQRKKKKGNGGVVSKSHMHGDLFGGYGIHEFSVENPTVSSSTQPGPSMQQGHQAPKMAFKKANHKSLNKAGPEQESLLVQINDAKVESTSSNYDDAMQFVKKRRYLQAANASGPAVPGGASSEYDVSVNMSLQPSDLQGSVSNLMDSDVHLSLDKSGIPDEVLQSLLEHYTQKPDGSHHDLHFDIGEQHVELNPASADGPDADSSGSSDKMHEYSRFLLQALERTSHSAAFSLGPGLPPSGPFTSSHLGNLLYADKNIYTTSPLDCGFGQPVASPSLPSSVPKSHFTMLTGPPLQHSFNLDALTHQQLTPSQELAEQMEKRHSSTPPSSYQINPSDPGLQKDQASVKTGAETIYSLDSSKPSYQIENFAQAFGAQFKSDGQMYGTDSGGEVDHRIRTPVSDFSGFSSLLSDVHEPGSAGSKTPTSQSYR